MRKMTDEEFTYYLYEEILTFDDLAEFERIVVDTYLKVKEMSDEVFAGITFNDKKSLMKMLMDELEANFMTKISEKAKKVLEDKLYIEESEENEG